jgi:predicted transposase YdaD
MEEGREEGRQEGRNEGVVLGKQQTLLRLLRKKFGDLPTGMMERVQAIASAESLDCLLDQVLEARTLDEMDLPDPSRDSR